tara:strand:+ start:92 stop:892 length:801 start_codon:yes stop_codon:yes gene_type:complete
MKLQDKTCIITGASSGIGESLARGMAVQGATVVLAARRQEKLDQVAHEINNSGGKALAQETDLTDPNQCKSLIARTIEIYKKLDVLILNAGVSMWTPFEDINDVSFFEQLMATNYMGAVHCVHAALPHLKAVNGMIVNCSTAQALVGFSNHSGYVASKHAIHGFLDTLEMEQEGAIQFLEVIMGWIKGTDLRANAFGPDGQKMGKTKRRHSSNSVGLTQCTNGIIRGIINGKKTIYIPWKLRLIPFLDLFLKGFIRRKIVRTVKSQ